MINSFTAICRIIFDRRSSLRWCNRALLRLMRRQAEVITTSFRFRQSSLAICFFTAVFLNISMKMNHVSFLEAEIRIMEVGNVWFLAFLGPNYPGCWRLFIRGFRFRSGPKKWPARKAEFRRRVGLRPTKLLVTPEKKSLVPRVGANELFVIERCPKGEVRLYYFFHLRHFQVGTGSYAPGVQIFLESCVFSARS